MIGALWILLATVVTGIILYVHHRLTAKPDEPLAQEPTEADEECCGQHIVCEKDSLLKFSDKIVYYDDEELDGYAGKEAGDYTDEEIEQFRDVLYTLRGEDVAGWARSMQLRNITLPPAIHDELLMLVNEYRSAQSPESIP